MSFDRLEQAIGYTFRDQSLLKTAFTHSSFAEKYGGESNERMEYLGDSVLQLLVSQKQYFEEGEKAEGELTKERQKLVCLDALYEEAERLGLKKYLRFFGKAASNIGKKTVSSLYETLVAAIYLDGGLKEAEKFVLANYPKAAERQENYKSALQEYLQKRGLPLPTYEGQKRGQDHAPTFLATARAGGATAFGEGASEKKAQQQAAKLLLETLKAKENTNTDKK